MKRGINHKRALAGLALVLLVLAGCSGGGDGAGAGGDAAGNSFRTWASHDEIVEAAKQEGSLKVLTSMQEETNELIRKGFTAKYPFIDMEIAEQTGSDDQRILLEIQSGANDTDVLHLSAESYVDYLPHLEKIDLLAMSQAGTLTLPKEMINPKEPNTMAAGAGLGGFAYNKKLLPEADLPKSWDDFLLPKFKGRQFIADIEPANLAVLAAAWGEDKLRTYAKAVGEQQPIWARGDTVSLTAMAAGEYRLHLGSNYHSAYRAQKKAPDVIGIVLLEPIPVRITQLQGIRKGAEHPAAATLLLEYLASQEVQDALDDLEPQQSSIYAPGSDLNKLTEGKQLAVQDWDSFAKTKPWQDLILQEWGFPTAQVKEE
jgi:iron(III) transport system substrate-binding protein